jgi:hypothetical protein
MKVWRDAYIYGVSFWHSYAVHVTADEWAHKSLCGVELTRYNRIPGGYPVCKNCLRTKRAKELGLK